MSLSLCTELALLIQAIGVLVPSRLSAFGCAVYTGVWCWDDRYASTMKGKLGIPKTSWYRRTNINTRMVTILSVL